jgi:HD superfamily phosphohydrolase
MSQDAVPKFCRIRDSVHGLITFSESDDFERLIWRLLDTAEFQRLRRIKQLGFSDLVYPGATHTRFSHSVGVFHMARRLVGILKIMLQGEFDDYRGRVAICAALLHDLGHGPFSHTFEGVEKSRGKRKKHEVWTAQIIREETEIGRVLDGFDQGLREDVAILLEGEHPTDIYASVVSSQFDADRLDYLRRDKLMTGTQHGGFDWDWLLQNLEIAEITLRSDGEDYLDVKSLILGPKGLKAAEGYLLGRFHLYTQIYMHKTTRGAEKMLGALLGGEVAGTGLAEDHALRRYFNEEGDTLENYLSLDDTVIWGALDHMRYAPDEVVSELAQRILNRRLYKCFDVGARATLLGDNIKARFRRSLDLAIKEDRWIAGFDILEDRELVSPYKLLNYENPSALSKVVIRRDDGSDEIEDVGRRSRIIEAMKEEEIFRVYARSPEVMQGLEAMWQEVTS